MYLCAVNNMVVYNYNGMKNDGLILRKGMPLLWQFDGGYVDLDANGTPTCWNYYVTDHLGSTRMVVSSNDSIRETINYYPFGSEMRMELPAQMTSDPSHPFRFTGKELDKQNGLNMYDFGARLFDVAGVPMWTSVDPLAEKYYPFTPYSYCAGDPVNKIDPDGKEVVNKFDQNDPNVQKANDLYIDKVNDEDDAIIVFAHGTVGGNGLTIQDKDNPTKIYDTPTFETFLNNNSEEWKNRFASGKDLKIILFSCETGVEGKFAQSISADPAFEGVKIVATADDVTIRENGTASVDHNKPWIEYTNGKVTNTYNGKILPGTKEFERASSWDKTWNKYCSHK